MVKDGVSGFCGWRLGELLGYRREEHASERQSFTEQNFIRQVQLSRHLVECRNIYVMSTVVENCVKQKKICKVT